MRYLIQAPSQLASHLRALRKAKGLTQAQLGEILQLDQTRIAKIERNPTRISVGQLLRHLAAIGVRMELHPTSSEEKHKSDTQHPGWGGSNDETEW